jgi:hypothetical protein
MENLFRNAIRNQIETQMKFSATLLQLSTDVGFRHEANCINFNMYSLSTTHLAVSLSRAEFVWMFIKICSIFHETG